MTQSTEQERAECRAAYEKYLCPYKGFPDQWTVWQAAWQASRRAQVVPQSEPVAYLWQHSETGRTRVVMPDSVITTDASWFVVGPLYLAAATQPPESNSAEFDRIKAEDDAEREALRNVYEAARGLLRYEGVDDGRAIIYRAKLNNAIEDVKQIDGGLWESPEAAPVQLPFPDMHYNGRALYAEETVLQLLAAQVRKPLTADQISAAFITEADAAIDDCASYTAGVRYAERAHGITERATAARR